MRMFVLAAGCAALLWSASAAASTITQNVSGNNRSGTFLTLFDPSLGTLDSVQVEGTLGWSEDLVRAGIITPFPVVNNPRTAPASLIHIGTGVEIASTSLTGSEVYPEGSIFGSISLSGTLFALLTGSAVNQFLVVGSRTQDLLGVASNVPPSVGSIQFNPGSPNGTYAVTITYNYTGVPEPATWAMMLLGFAAIGLSLRYRVRTARSAS